MLKSLAIAAAVLLLPAAASAQTMTTTHVVANPTATKTVVRTRTVTTSHREPMAHDRYTTNRRCTVTWRHHRKIRTCRTMRMHMHRAG